jgi:acetyltransferase EpsM
MQSLVIFGGPGSGALVADSVSAMRADGRGVRVVGFLNDALPRGSLVHGVPVLGAFASWRELPEETRFIAPLHKVKLMQARASIVRRLGIPEHRWATVIDPRSAVASDAVIAHACFVGPFASVGPGARLGSHTVVRAGAHVSHDCRIGDFVFIGTNAVICGSSAVDHGAYVAPGSTVRDSCRIGKFATVGLGSVVVKEVPAFGVVAGTPARQFEGAPEGQGAQDM